MDYLLTLLVVAVLLLAIFSVGPAVRVLSRQGNFSDRKIPQIMRNVRTSLSALAITIVMEALLPRFNWWPDAWVPRIDHILTLLMIAVVTWFITDILEALEELAIAKLSEVPDTDDVRVRRVVTQIFLLRRLASSIIIIIGVASALRTFPAAEGFGTGIIASAGLLSIVAGLAAQTSLTNVFAGLQLALTNGLRVDDIVAMEEESGVVDEVTLTYVVIRLWDERRLILPSSYFVTQPFENWTRSRGRLAGSIELDVDWTAPIDEMRAHMLELVEASPLWDKRRAFLSVANATGGYLRIRIGLSADDTEDLFDLQAYMREEMVKFLVARGVGTLPRKRMEMMSAPENRSHTA